MSVTCTRCGSPLLPNARFCTGCGASQASAGAPLYAPQVPHAPQVAHAPHAAPTPVFLSATARALLSVAFFAGALVLVPLVLFSGGSLYTSRDGSSLVQDAQVGLLAGFLWAAATLAAVVWGASRMPNQGEVVLGALLGAGVGLVAAFGLGAETNGAAHADVVNGSTFSTPIFHETLGVLLLGLAVAVAIAMNASRAPPYLGFVLLVAGTACIAVASLGYDGWLLQNASSLRAAASARAHYRTPLSGWIALAALVGVALLLRRRRAA